MSRPRILIVDDQFTHSPDLRAELCERLGLVDIALDADERELATLPEDAICAVFCSGQIAHGERMQNSLDTIRNAVQAGWPSQEGWRWALVFLDVRFDAVPATSADATFGLRALAHLVEAWPDRKAAPGNSELPLVVLSSSTRDHRGKDANRAGARAYVEKSELDQAILSQLLEHHGLIEDYALLGRPEGSLLLGRSFSMLKALREARRISRIHGRGNAMILGPQGSGKTALASYVHAWSKRAGRLAHYFASPTLEQIEYASLFGCWQGVYTGQRKESYPGVAEFAHQGTLLIDEVHNLKTANQAELLEFARLDQQNRRWLSRLGKTIPTSPRDAHQQARRSVIGTLDKDSSKIAVDVLLLTASSESIHDVEWRQQQMFSEPLYTRLAVEYAGQPLAIPGLNNRRSDIPLLFSSFLAANTPGASPDIDSEVHDVLAQYGWPGNVAELQGVAHYVANAARGFDVVYTRHLPPRLVTTPSVRRTPTQTTATPSESFDVDDLEGMLERATIDTSTRALHGKLTSLQEAYGDVVFRLLSAALDATRNRTGAPRSDALGDLVPTRAVKLLRGQRKMTSAQAASEIIRLSKLFSTPLPPGSDVEKVLLWAKALRSPRKL